MKFLIAFALVATVAAVPVKFQPDQVIFVSDVPSDIFARIDFGPAIVEHSHVLIADDVNSQVFNAAPIQTFDGDLPKPSPVMVVDIAENVEASEPIEAVQVVDYAETVEAAKVAEDTVAVDPVQIVDIAEYIEAVEAAQADETAETAEISEFAKIAENFVENAKDVEAVQVVEVAQDAPFPVISENIPEVVQSIVLAEPNLPEVASDILY